METLPSEIEASLEDAALRPGPVVWLTGAGISSESGIPTFRGKDGYWHVGSKHYHPEEMATRAAFDAMPEEVWSWYLYRRSVCNAASPNAAHLALVNLERSLEDRFLLVTQNVDGLHLRAGNSEVRTYQIHGNINCMRCVEECSVEIFPIDTTVEFSSNAERRLTYAEFERLRCPRCNARSRPHVLWFDEYYDEPRFRFDSSLKAATSASLLVVVGTSGATNLPMQIGFRAARERVPMVVVNLESNPFSQLAERGARVGFLEGKAGEWVPLLCDAIRARS